MLLKEGTTESAWFKEGQYPLKKYKCTPESVQVSKGSRKYMGLVALFEIRQLWRSYEKVPEVWNSLMDKLWKYKTNSNM